MAAMTNLTYMDMYVLPTNSLLFIFRKMSINKKTAAAV